MMIAGGLRIFALLTLLSGLVGAVVVWPSGPQPTTIDFFVVFVCIFSGIYFAVILGAFAIHLEATIESRNALVEILQIYQTDGGAPVVVSQSGPQSSPFTDGSLEILEVTVPQQKLSGRTENVSMYRVGNETYSTCEEAEARVEALGKR